MQSLVVVWRLSINKQKEGFKLPEGAFLMLQLAKKRIIIIKKDFFI